MTDQDYKQELVELIKHYQAILYNYRQYPNYRHDEIDCDEAEKRLEYYTEKYCETLK